MFFLVRHCSPQCSILIYFNSFRFMQNRLKVNTICYKTITLNRVDNSFGFSVTPNLCDSIDSLQLDSGGHHEQFNTSTSSTELSALSFKRSSSGSSVKGDASQNVRSAAIKCKSNSNTSHDLSPDVPDQDQPPLQRLAHADFEASETDPDHKYSEEVATIGRDWVKVQVKPSRSKRAASPQCHSLHVSHIKPDGACALSGSRLQVGDRLIQINGIDVNRLNVSEVIRLLRTSGNLLQLIAIDSSA